MTLAASFSITESFQSAFTTLFNYLPELLGALIILVVGYLIARLIEKVLARLLVKVRVNESLERAGVQEALDRSGTGLTPATLIAKVVFWFVFLMVLTMFASALGVPAITNFLNQMIAYIPNIFAAIVILFLAVIFSRFLARVVRGVTNSEVLGKATRIVIMVYATFIALVQLHIAQALTGPTFLIVLAGAALAAGLAFGLGGRAEAERFISRAVASSRGWGSHRGADPQSPGTFE